MTDKMEQFDRNNSQDFSDEAVRRFLLGRLDVTEQTAFEQHLFTDDGLETRVRLAEFDLADDYALERLSAADRVAFEQKFLLSAGRKRKLNVSSALRDRFASSILATTAPKGAKASISERWQLLFGLNQRVWRLAFGVAILVVLVGMVWLLVKEPRIKEGIRVVIFNRRAPAPAPTPRLAGHSNNTSSPPEHHTTPSPMPPHESPVILRVGLFSDVSRDHDKIPLIDLPKGEHDIVRLQLALKPNQTGIYRAELLTKDGSSVFRADSLKVIDPGAGIDFNVPARLLRPGDYQIRLGGPGNEATAVETKYYFRVSP
jgi:hypothetical protein